MWLLLCGVEQEVWLCEVCSFVGSRLHGYRRKNRQEKSRRSVSLGRDAVDDKNPAFTLKDLIHYGIMVYSPL